MPPLKTVQTLNQLSISTLTKLIIRVIQPQFLNKLCDSCEDDKNHKTFDDQAINEEPILSPLKDDSVTETVNTHNLSVGKDGSFEQDETPDVPLPDTSPVFSLVNDLNGDIPSDDINTTTMDQLKVVQEFVVNLVKELTSHSHCTLHELLLASILPQINLLYMKYRHQIMRKLTRRIVPLFINTSIRVFDFGSLKMFTEASMFKAVYAKLKDATGLEKLVFGRSCYWRSQSILILSEVLQGMKNLQVLHIHYICQPEMLHNLANSCPRVRELSLKGSKDITDNEITLLTQFNNLDTLDISGTSVTGRACRSLILNLPFLTWLTHCPFNCNSDTLIFESRAQLFNYIKDQLNRQPPLAFTEENRSSLTIHDPHYSPEDLNKQSGKSSEDNVDASDVSTSSTNGRKSNANGCEGFYLKLKCFWLFNMTTEELLLTHLCPHLEHLRLDFVMQDLSEEPDMTAVRNLPHLSSLTINSYDRCPIQLVTSTIEFTSYLTTLHLHLGDEWFFVAPIMNVISQSCHNLTHLTMEGDYKGQHSLEESDGRLDFSLPAEGLCHLQEARLAGCVSDLRLLHLLTQAPNLHVLHLDGELEWLHDDTFSDVIRLNLLLNLRILWFNVSTGITFNSVRYLLHSQNNLQRIGRMCLMSSASKELYQDLLCLVKKLNLSTELIWVTDQRELLKPSISIQE